MSTRPTTKAGVALAHSLDEAEGIHVDDRICAIEAEAAAAVLSRIRERVEGLLLTVFWDGWSEVLPETLDRAAVLAILAPQATE